MMFSRLAAILVAACAMLFSGAAIKPAMAQTLPHAEDCTEGGWGFLRAVGYEFGAINLCNYQVTVWFMLSEGEVIEDTVQPGSAFRTGIKSERFDQKKGWIAATCQAGYVPTIKVSQANWDDILKSRYECAKR